MARLSPIVAGLALFVIITFVAADEKCRSGCQGVTPNHFKYADGTTYKYNLESNIDIALSSAEGQQTTTKLKATVLLTQQPECNQVLRLQNVQIIGPDGKKHGTVPDLDKAIRINFHDGHVEDVICTEHGDTQNSLNIKRAVASLFQSAMTHNHETDVFGVCPTEFHNHKEGNVEIITKSRVLNRCSHRENVKHDFMATAFNIHSEIKSSPILKSDYQVEQRIKDGILDHVLLTENYLYMPFSIGKNGAKATVQTKLQFAGKSKDAPKVKCAEPKSIIFESPHPTIAPKCDVSTILQAVKDTANSIKVIVDEKTASKFSNLIKIMGAAKKDDLLAVYNQVRSGAGFSDKVTAKKVFLDAIFRAGTGECLEVAIELLKNKELSPIEQKMVYLGMAFVRHATPNSMTSAAALLDLPNLPREAYLGVGTLAARYCKSHDCKNVDQLNKLTAKLLGKLKDGKAANRQQENEIISILKAITNMKHLTDSAVPKLTSIAQDKKGPIRVRVAALEAYQADACKDKLRDSAISILKDIQQDSEIRIKAYLALAQCPNGKVANAIKAVLDNEPSYQVGGFIVSHIRNLRASANPDKELAKRELANINTMKRFPIDPRKYSFNNEFSYAFDTFGLSSSAESNLIYSQNSFLPRSTSLNLTTEVFGHKFNFLEVDTRQENLDKLVEHYLGPLGVLRNKDPEDLVASGKESGQKIIQHFRERLDKSTRAKRHVPKAEMDSMAKQVQIKTNELNTDLDLDMSIKLFGSEFLFLSLNEDAQKLSPNAIIDKIFDRLDTGMDKIKSFDHTFQHNCLFLDTELSYPTSMGFPLRLGVEGTYSANLKAAGAIDLRALIDGNKDSIVKLSLIPSVNVQISGSMLIDTSIMENGLKVVSTLHTATGGALEVDFFNRGKGVDVKFSLPIQKQHLIDAKHEVVFSTREAGTTEVLAPLKFIENKDFMICLDQLSSIIGLSACVELNSPNYQLNQGVILPFPLNGNSKIGVWIDKEFPVTYHIRDVFYDDQNKLGFEFILEALGENNQPKVSLLIEGYAAPEKYIRATLDSPIKKATVEGRITDNEHERSISGKFQHDNQEYSGKFGIAIAGGGNKVEYTPLIEYNTPTHGVQKSPYTVEGTITGETSGDKVKYTFNNIKLVAPNKPKISITGTVEKEPQAVGCDVSVTDGTNTGSLKGNVKVSNDLIKLSAEMKNTMSPISNFHLDYQLKRADYTFTQDLSLIHGADLSEKSNLFKMHNTLTRKYKNPEDYKFATKNSISYPLLGVEGKFELLKVPKTMKYDIEGKYNNIKVGSEMELEYNKKTKGDYDFELEIQGFDNKLKAEAKREITGDKSKIENSVEVNGQKFETNGVITHKVNPNDVEVGAQLTIKCPKNEPLTIDHNLALIPDDVKTHLKVSNPATTFVDFDLKASKTAGANGHLKATLPGVLNANGEIKAEKWIGKAFLVTEFLKVQRKVKLDSTFKITEPVYDVALSLYPNFEKDPKKITIASNNKIQENAMESSNNLDVFGHKMEVNVKGTKEGEPAHNGKITGEIETILPNEMYFAGKISRERHLENGVGTGNIFLNVEQRKNKNTPGRKATLKADGKHIDLKKHNYDITYNLELFDTDGKTLNGDLALKRTSEADGHNVDIKGSFSGSVLKAPWTYELGSNYKNFAGVYHVKSSCPEVDLKLEGKYDGAGGDKPVSGSVNLDVKTQNPALKTIQFAASGSLLRKEDNVDMSGSTKIFIDDDGSNPDATVDINAEGEVKMGVHNGQVKGTLKFQKADPISLAVGYGHKDEEGGVSKCFSDISLTYATGKNIKADISVIRPNQNEWKIDAKLDTPFENAKHTQFTHHAKKSEDFKQISSDMTLTVDGKKYVLDKDLVISDTKPLIKIELTLPDGKVDKFYAKVDNAGSKQFAGELQVVHNAKDFTFDGMIDAHAQSIEDFSVTIKLDSPKLKLEKIILEAKNQNNKAAKVIEVEASSNGNNILKGSATYKTREEGGKYIAEGSGEFMVRDAKKSGNFKFIRQNLSFDKNGEQGMEIAFDAGLGNKAVDAELKVTNKQFRLLNSYCEEKKQCAHFEVDSKTSVMDVADYHHELEVNVDLRKLGLLHEFGLKAVTKRKQFILDHTVDVHFQSDENNKYQYSLFLHPKEAGISLTTPKRQIALEGHISLPNKGKGPIKGELAMYLDKKAEPTKKTAISGSAEYTGDRNNGVVKAEAKFITPGLAKDMAVTYNSKHNTANRLVEYALVLDIFNRPNNKVVVTGKGQLLKDDTNGKYSYENHGSIKSAGMNLEFSYDETTFYYDAKTHTFKYMIKSNLNVEGKKCSSGYLLEFNPSKYHTMFKLFDKEIYNIESKIQMGKESQVIDTEARVHGMKPVTSHFELKGYNTMKYVLASKENPNHQLVINSAFIPGQIADFRAEVDKSELLRASIKLDEANFLKPDYAISNENIKNLLLDPARQELEHVIAEGKTLITDTAHHLEERNKMIAEVAKKNIPNFKPAADYYRTEIQKLKEEIVADKTIQQLSEILKNVFGIAARSVSEILVKANELISKMAELAKLNAAKISEMLEKEIIPALKSIASRLYTDISAWLRDISAIVFTIIGKLSAFLEAHQAELKQIATSISAITQEVGRFLYLNYERLREVVIDHMKRIYEEIKALPIYEEIKARYELLMKDFGGVSEQAINVMKDALNTLKDLIHNDDVKKLITSISDYLEKKMRNEKIDDLAALEKIARNFLVTIKKLWASLKMQDIKLVDPSIFSINYFNALPRLVAAKFSPLNYLLGTEVSLDMVKENMYGVSFNPRSWLPPFRLYAFLVQGQHVFTFDGKHVTFPGKCNYLLARDALNGNFTIAGTYTNGLLTALTVADKTDSITMKKGGQAMLNKDASDFPVRRPQMEAYRTYETMNIHSKAGVDVSCDTQLLSCTFSISGFYHGQLRGLLGNGNNEPYDDFVMPNGKIVTSESDFGNAYKMAASCAPVKTVDHSTHQHAASCSKLFGSTSSMRFCFPFVNVENYRTACDHGVAAGVKDTELAVAMGYVAACNAKFIPIRLPEEFVQCKNGDEPRHIGDKFSVKLPAKAADIVVIVEQNKNNEVLYKELVQPMVAELTKELASKGITDTEYHLIGYGGDYQEYPSHFTNGGKMSWKGKLPSVKFSEEPEKKTVDLGQVDANNFVALLRRIGHDIKLATGCTLKSRSFIEALDYPFRANAAKVIVSFTGSPCEHGSLLVLQRVRSILLRDPSIHLNLITPFNDFKLKDAKSTKNVIGFDNEKVFTFTDAKKNPDGLAELHKELEYNDFCTDYTLSAGGNVFVTDNFLHAKGPQRKQYMQVLTHNVVDQIVNTEQGLDCVCDYETTMHGLNQCTTVHTKETEHK